MLKRRKIDDEDISCCRKRDIIEYLCSDDMSACEVNKYFKCVINTLKLLGGNNDELIRCINDLDLSAMDTKIKKVVIFHVMSNNNAIQSLVKKQDNPLHSGTNIVCMNIRVADDFFEELVIKCDKYINGSIGVNEFLIEVGDSYKRLTTCTPSSV